MGYTPEINPHAPSECNVIYGTPLHTLLACAVRNRQAEHDGTMARWRSAAPAVHGVQNVMWRPRLQVAAAETNYIQASKILQF